MIVYDSVCPVRIHTCTVYNYNFGVLHNNNNFAIESFSKIDPISVFSMLRYTVWVSSLVRYINYGEKKFSPFAHNLDYTTRATMPAH